MARIKQAPGSNVEFLEASRRRRERKAREQIHGSSSEETLTATPEPSESRGRRSMDTCSNEQSTRLANEPDSNFPPVGQDLTTLFSQGESTEITADATSPYVQPTNGWLTQVQRANVEFLSATTLACGPPMSVSRDITSKNINADGQYLSGSPPPLSLAPTDRKGPVMSNAPQASAANTSFLSGPHHPRARQNVEIPHEGANGIEPHYQLPGNTDSIQSMPSLYTSLEHLPKSIRLLRIEAGPSSASSDDVYCVLSIAQPWHHPVSYDCLSYCWGSTTAKSQVLIRTPGSQYRAVTVTANLYDALRSLRNTHMSMYLWADALSINQADLRERASQVTIMKDIYNMASCIVVWLGESNLGLARAIASISAISKTFEVDIPGIGSITGTSGLHMRAADVKRLGSYNGSTAKGAYEALGELFSLPYFRRVW